MSSHAPSALGLDDLSVVTPPNGRLMRLGQLVLVTMGSERFGVAGVARVRVGVALGNVGLEPIRRVILILFVAVAAEAPIVAAIT